VTVREILAEWARVGQTRIVNGEKLAGGPVTLELNDVPEAQALDAVLRSAAGYVMAPRVTGAPGPSRYDRIMILATSRAPVVTASSPTPFNNRPMPQVQQNPPADDEPDFGPGANGGVVAQPGANAMPMPTMPGPQPQQQLPGQVGQQGQQTPITATRPGQLPAPATNGPAVPPNPYLGTPPGPAAPGFNPNPPPPPTTPRGPGGPGGM
jgi:Wiskott-Aldrich syndrome protein